MAEIKSPRRSTGTPGRSHALSLVLCPRRAEGKRVRQGSREGKGCTHHLVLVGQERKSFRFSCFLVSYQVDVHHLTILREDGKDVAWMASKGTSSSDDA